jgi:2-keto-3-deoxy-L-rhamnonate aldolase RhmA
MEIAAKFRRAVRERTPLVGTFIKTASHQIPEILGHAGLDFGVIDAEHAPFGLGEIDRMVLGGLAAGLPCLVRVPDRSSTPMAQCLDLGAAGVLVPHVATAGDAQAAAASVRFSFGQRGFSPSPRAGLYGAYPQRDYADKADQASSLWCQIEDASALDALDSIAAIEAIDCLFIGPADLGRALKAEPGDPILKAAINRVAEAGMRHQRAVGIHVSRPADIAELRALGISVFTVGSDQSLLLSGAREIAGIFPRA